MTPTPNLQRLRYAVRGVLVLGMGASVAANVLHADPNPISKVIAAWPPIALLLAIELVTHVPADRRQWVAWLRRGGTLLIAGIAAYVSYWHMAGVAERYGESGLSVFLLPLSVDGLIAVSSICLVEISGRLRAEKVPEPPAIHVIDPGGQGVGRWTPAEAIEPTRTVAPARDEPDRPQTVAPDKPRTVRGGQSVAASSQAAADRMGIRDPRRVWEEVKRTTHPDAQFETVRRSLRPSRNGHRAVQDV